MWFRIVLLSIFWHVRRNRIETSITNAWYCRRRFCVSKNHWQFVGLEVIKLPVKSQRLDSLTTHKGKHRYTCRYLRTRIRERRFSNVSTRKFNSKFAYTFLLQVVRESPYIDDISLINGKLRGANCLQTIIAFWRNNNETRN